MSWKQYGGTNNFNVANNIRTHALVCDLFTLREAYQGEFDISGKLIVYDDVSFQAMLNVTGNTYLHSDLFVQMDTSMQGNLFVGGNESLVGQFFIGDNSSQYFYGLSGGTGIGLNTMNPQATLDICGNQIHVLNVFSTQSENLNTIAQNVNQYGITVDAQDYTSTIDFYGRDENTFAVSTIAGIYGIEGTFDASGLNATFNFPLDIITDVCGNFYVVDADVIRKITLMNGIYNVTSLAGTPGVYGYKDGFGFPRSTSQITNSFNFPYGIVVDSDLNLYIADTNNNLIRKATRTIDGSYNVTTIAGNVATLNANGYTNSGIQNNSIPPPHGQKIGNNGGYSDGIGINTFFDAPSGIVIDKSGNILVADSSNNVIRKLTVRPSDGSYNVTTVAGQPGVASFQDGTGSNALFNYPFSLTIDDNGTMYVIDAYNNVVRKMTYASDGSLNVVTIAGNYNSPGFQYQDGIGTNALFNFPGSITAKGNGNVLYVSDKDNNLMRKIELIKGGINDGSYNVTTIAGLTYITVGSSTIISNYNTGYADGVGNVSAFNFPAGIAQDLCGNLIVTDTNNQLIRKVYPISDMCNNQIPYNQPASQLIYNANYITGKTLEIKNIDNLYIDSKVSISVRPDEISHINNEPLIIYDISAGPFLLNVYKNPSCITGNALTLVSNDLSSNTFLNITTPLNQYGNTLGISIGGGAYPSDTSRSMGMIGWTDLHGVFQTTQTIVSGTDPIKYKSTLGVNTYHPITEQYIMDINGPVRFSNGTIVNISDTVNVENLNNNLSVLQPFNFEIKTMGISRSNPNQLIAVGSPSTIGNGLYIPYAYNVLVSTDAGSSWSLYPISCTNSTSNLQFQQSPHSFISTYVYDSSYALIGSNDGYMFYTVNGGVSWAKITLFNPADVSFNSSINSIYIAPFDNGQNFYQLNTNISNSIHFTGIAMSSNGQYQYSCSDGSGIFISYDFGVTWLQITYISGISFSNKFFTAIHTNSSGKTILVCGNGSKVNFDNNFPLYSSVDFGNSWESERPNNANNNPNLNNPTNIFDISFTSVAISDNSVFKIATSSKTNAFNSSNNPLRIDGSGTIMFFVEGNFWYFNDYSPIIYNITSVALIESNSNFANVNSKIQDASNNVVVSNGNGIWIGLFHGQYLKYTQVFNNASYFTSVAVSYDGKYITACSFLNGIWISSNYGMTWSQTTTNLNNINFTSVTMTSNGTYQTACSLGSGIWFSSNYGINWTRTNNSNINFKSIAFSNDISVRTVVSDASGLFNYNVTNKRTYFTYNTNCSYFDIDFTKSPYSNGVDSSLNFYNVTFGPYVINGRAMDGFQNFLYFTTPTTSSSTYILQYNIVTGAYAPYYINNSNQNIKNKHISVYQNYVLTSSRDTISLIDIANNLIYSVNNVANGSLPFGTYITINNIYLYDNLSAVAIASDGYNNPYLLKLFDYNQWSNIGADILNSSGNENLLINDANTLTNIIMPNLNTLLISNTTIFYNASTNTLGKSNIFNCFFPNLYNSAGDFVLDISGSLRTSGDMTMNNGYATNVSIDNGLNVKGYIQLPDNSILISSIPDFNYSQIGIKWIQSTTNNVAIQFNNYSSTNVCHNVLCMSSNGQYQYLITNTHIIASYNYGINWFYPSPLFNEYIAVTLNQFTIATSSSGQYVTIPTFPIYYSHDYGKTWIYSNDIKTDQGQNSSVKISSTGQYQTCAFQNTIYYSNNYGVNWFRATVTLNSSITSLAMSASGKYQLVSCSSNGVFISENFGLDWFPIQINTSQKFYNAIISSTGQYQSVSTINQNKYNYIYNSDNYGKTWNISTIDGIVDNSFNGITSMSMISSGEYKVSFVTAYDSDPYDNNTYNSSILISSDYGLTWNTISSNLNGTYAAICMSANGKYMTGLNISTYTIWYSIIPYATVFTDQLLFSASGVLFDLSSLTIAGNVYANSYNVTSDYRVKKNVELLDDAFVVDGLRPITYFNEMTAKQDIGFLAHEVQELYPYLVSGSKDDPDYQSLNYIGLIGILVKEIKELKRGVKDLRQTL